MTDPDEPWLLEPLVPLEVLEVLEVLVPLVLLEPLEPDEPLEVLVPDDALELDGELVPVVVELAVE